MKQFWKWNKAEASSQSELVIDGVIASESWWDDEVTPKAFREELAQHAGAITVRITSPGGDVSAGVAIYNYLNEHEGEVTVKVDGIAASIASLIAMAGDKIVMLPGAMIMVHQPWTFAAGNSDDLEQVVEMLKKTCESMVPIYAARTGLSEDRINELLKAETWMTAEDAVELGFADEAVPAKSGISASIKNAISYASSVQSAVMQPVMSIQARKAEAPESEEVDDTDTQPTSNEDATNENQATPSKNGDEATPDAGGTDPAEDKQPVKKEITEVKQEDIAKAQVMEPKNQAPVDVKDTKQTFAEYLKSPRAVADFANVLAMNTGEDNPEAAQAVRAAWKDISIKNGLSEDSEDYFRLPDPIVTQIEDAVKASGIFNALSHTGLDVRRVDWDDADEDADTSRAGGHKKGTSKEEQVLDFDKRVIRAQYIYKYLTLNKQDVRENRSTGALIRFVMNELPTRVIREIERAVVIGDGRASNNDRKIQAGNPEGFYPIKADAAANNIFATRYVPVVGESRYESLIRALDELETEGAIYLIHKKGYLTDLKLEQSVNGTYLFPVGSNVSEAIGFAGTFQPTWFKDSTDPDNDAYIVVLSGYETVGDSSIESFTNFILKENKHEYLQEIYKGGGLAKRRAAVAIAKASAPSA